jgi:hypothetical protein
MIWHKAVRNKLDASGLFHEVLLVGAKVRATLDDARFFDVHYDPTTGSYSYALIDLSLPFAGDKRVMGWDDYAHEGVAEIKALASYPHHFQKRAKDGHWVFEESPMRGDVIREMDIAVAHIRSYLEP